MGIVRKRHTNPYDSATIANKAYINKYNKSPYKTRTQSRYVYTCCIKRDILTIRFSFRVSEILTTLSTQQINKREKESESNDRVSEVTTVEVTYCGSGYCTDASAL